MSKTNGSKQEEATGKLPPCPICGKPSTLEARPFCSKRCADVDLHRWLNDRYVIPSSPDEEDSVNLPDSDALDR